MLGLIMTAVYLYKMYSWYDSPKASPKAMTALFVISSLFLGLISIIIVIVIFWQSKKLLIDKEEAEWISVHSNKLTRLRVEAPAP